MFTLLITTLALADEPLDRDQRHAAPADQRHAAPANQRHGAAHVRPGWRRPPPPRRHVTSRPPAPPPPARGQPRGSEQHDVSLTLSAVHLAVPMAAVNAEFRLGERSSVGLVGGLGAYQGATLVELGGEARAYPVGDFDRGLYLGAGVRYTSVPYYVPTDASAAAAVFVGGKYTFDFPLTIEGQLGPQLAANDHGLTFGPAVKVNVGFSF